LKERKNSVSTKVWKEILKANSASLTNNEHIFLCYKTHFSVFLFKFFKSWVCCLWQFFNMVKTLSQLLGSLVISRTSRHFYLGSKYPKFLGNLFFTGFLDRVLHDAR
jgi:hypothetical protein